MNVIRFFCIISFIIITSGCAFDKVGKVKLSEEINRYNYLDVSYENKYIYDFEKIFSEKEIEKLYSKLKNFDKKNNSGIIIITDKKSKLDAKTNARVTNDIFKEKFDFKRIITIKVFNDSKEVGVGYSKNLDSILNDSIVNRLIEKVMIKKFKNGEYFQGVNQSIDSLIKLTH